MILSVSRRTDIPAFYSEWFFDNLKKGYVLVPNPMNMKKIAKISLKPLNIKSVSTNLIGEKNVEIDGELEGIVFWTKNPKPMLNRLNELKDIKYYFLYTITGYPENVESGLPSLNDRINSFKQLSKHCPVIWRYDPILLTKGIDMNWHIENFSKLCSELDGYTSQCKVSFVINSYTGCDKSIYAPSNQEKHKILFEFSKIAKQHNIQIQTCADGGNWSEYGIVPSKCIDGDLFEELLNEKFSSHNIVVKRKNNKLDGQRKFCGCMPAIDIGRYDTCHHGCAYCYARKSTQKRMFDELFGEIYDRKLELEFDYK